MSEPSGRVFDARESGFGRYFDELEVGDLYRHWPGKTLTEADNHLFCLLTMAASPIHLDREYAAAHVAGGENLIVGTYVYSLLLGMSVPDISGKAVANLGVRELRHVAPMVAGDTLYGESLVTAKRPSASRAGEGIIEVETTGRNQRGEIVCTYTRSVLLPMRSA